MKALPFLLALLLAWLAVAGGDHLTGYPHFLSAGGSTPFWWTTSCIPPATEALQFAVAVALLGPLSLMLSASLALWGRRQRRGGAGKAAGAQEAGDQRDLWLAG